MYGCDMQDHGLQILYQRLEDCDITITKLSLSKNGLTKSSAAIISNMAIRFKVKVLGLRFNERIGENDELYPILTSPYSLVEKLDISSTKRLPNRFFTALGKSTTLKELWITNNNLTNKSCGAIVKAIKKCPSLVKLMMYRNPISRRHVQHIARALRHNDTIENLILPYYPS